MKYLITGFRKSSQKRELLDDCNNTSERPKLYSFGYHRQRLILLCLFSISALAPALQADDFQAGIDAYHESGYTEAIVAFERDLASGERAATRHNLALSHYQQGQPGAAPEAIWQLERATRLDPFNQNYLFKLGVLRQQLGLFAAPAEWWQAASRVLTPATWIWIAAISGWCLLAGILVPRIGGFSRPIAVKLFMGLAIVSLVLSSTALTIQATQQASGVIITDAPTVLHHAPASAAPEAGLARPGERAQVIDQHNNFLKIKTEAQITGWIENSQFREL